MIMIQTNISSFVVKSFISPLHVYIYRYVLLHSPLSDVSFNVGLFEIQSYMFI